MKWLRAPVLVVLLMPACSLLVQNEDFFDGASKNGGAAGMRTNFDAGDGLMAAGGMSGAADAGIAEPTDTAGTAGSAGEASPGGGALGASGGALGASGGAIGAIGAAGDASSGATTSASGGGGGAPASPCDHPECTPKQVDMGKQSCGACNTGQQARMRICSADTCTWGAWSAWSACSGVTATCAPGQTTTCPNGDDCGQRVCTSSCGWGACAPKAAGECLRIGPGHTDQGSNFRCCGASKWEFCLPTCQWSTTCEACGSECGC